MALKLDKSRPYGEVHPPYLGAHYEQGGLYFRADLSLIDGEEGDTLHGKDAKAKIKTAEREARAHDAARAAYDAEMAKEPGTGDKSEAARQRAADAAAKVTPPPAAAPVEIGKAAPPAAPEDDENLSDKERSKAARDRIVLWARGELDVPFHVLKTLFEEGLSVKIINVKDAKEKVIDKGILPEAEVKR